jgi:hypothetical protein
MGQKKSASCLIYGFKRLDPGKARVRNTVMTFFRARSKNGQGNPETKVTFSEASSV